MMGSFSDRELRATLASRHTVVCTDAHHLSIRQVGFRSILGVLGVYTFIAASTRSICVLFQILITAKQ